MGLTIHYKLKSTGVIANARKLVEALHQKAMDLPFESVQNVVELKGDAANYNNMKDTDPNRWLAIQAQWYGNEFSATPSHIIAFETFPGAGCEPANFGLCKYPKSITNRHGETIYTGLTGWKWSSFCKTQYASRSGVPHFVKCHLLVIKMLDIAKELGILDEVSDEGDYWTDRNVEALGKCVGEWNADIAGLVGQLKDLAGKTGDEIVAPITTFPDYEHLEAKGRK